MKKHDRMAGLFLIVVGITTGVHAWLNLKLGSLSRPDSGFMPFIASILMIVCSVTWILNSRGTDEKKAPLWVPGEWYRPAFALAILVAYALTMSPLGYLLSTLLFMLAWQFLVEREKWLKATIVSVLGTAGIYLLFVTLLGVPVPPGILSL